MYGRNVRSPASGPWLAEAQETAYFQRRYCKAALKETAPDGEQALAQSYEALLRRYTEGISTDAAVPEALQRMLMSDLITLTATTGLGVARASLSALEPWAGLSAALNKTREALIWHTGRLSNLLARHEETFSGYLGLAARADYSRYVFLSEEREHSCDRCTALHGRLLTLEELSAENLIPPLHINCQCRIVSIDNRAEALYNLNKEAFLHGLDRLFDEAGQAGGGIYLLGHDGLRTVSPLTVSAASAIRERTDSSPGWYERLAAWAEKFGRDAATFGEAFLARWEELGGDSRRAFQEGRYLLGTLYGGDFLTFGIVSGMYENLEQQYSLLEEKRDLPHLLNFFLQGLPAVVEGALQPEEALSFQHVMDIMGVATVLAGAAKVVGKPRAGVMEAPPAGLVDIGLEAAAQRGGKITKVLSADELNAAYLKLNPTHEAPYMPGTKIYYVKTTGEIKFVRVYGGKSGKVKEWIMNADDIKGLTPEQIQDKFSLPQRPEYICEVAVPYGTRLEVSIANGILGGKGGGVQYTFIGRYYEEWFMNEKNLPYL